MAMGVAALASAASVMAARGKPIKPDDNLPLPAPRLIRLLEHGEFNIVGDDITGYSTMGSRLLTLYFSKERKRINVKWKPAPESTGEGWNNSPRREMAAYIIQQLFLDPEDYVVPPTTIRCIPMNGHSTIDPHAKPNIKPFQCMYGAFAAWLMNVEMPKAVCDKKRFSHDKCYAYHLANMNLLSYLINHRDGVIFNYLYSTNPANPRVFCVDNGLSLRPEIHNIFVKHWNKIRVPALPRKSIERLRKVTRNDLERLGVLAQMDADENGVLHNVEPRENLDPKVGSRIFQNTIQVGLTESEIDTLGARLEKLLRHVDRGTWELL